MPQFHEQYPETAPDAAHYGFNVGFMTGMLELGVSWHLNVLHHEKS